MDYATIALGAKGVRVSEELPAREEAASGGHAVVNSAREETAESSAISPKTQKRWWEPLSVGSALQLLIAAGVGLSLIKLSAVAGAKPALAVAILKYAGYVNPILYVGLRLFPVALMLLVLRILEYRSAAIEAKTVDGLSRWSIPLAIWAALAIMYLAPWYVFVGGTALLVISLLLDRRWRRRARRYGERLSAERYMARRRFSIFFEAMTLLVGLLLLQISSPDMWLLQEEISVEQRLVHGYFLGEDGGWVVILEDDPRQLLYAPADSVESRVVCRTGGDARTVLQFLAREEISRPGQDCS